MIREKVKTEGAGVIGTGPVGGRQHSQYGDHDDEHEGGIHAVRISEESAVNINVDRFRPRQIRAEKVIQAKCR